MEEIKSKISYIKGLAAGLDIEKSSKEGQLFTSILEALDLMAEELEELHSNYDELFEYTEAIDEDLTELESDFYDVVDDEDSFVEDDDDDDVISLECPDCGEITYLDVDFLGEDQKTEIFCPNCERVVFIDEETEVLEQESDDTVPRDEGDNS